MRFIPTKLHAPLDYIVGAGLIAAPWIFQFSDLTTPTVLSIVLGIGLIIPILPKLALRAVWRQPARVRRAVVFSRRVSWPKPSRHGSLVGCCVFALTGRRPRCRK